MKKGHNSSFHAQLLTMGDNPRRVQDIPLRTIGGVVFTRIFYKQIFEQEGNADPTLKPDLFIFLFLTQTNFS